MKCAVTIQGDVFEFDSPYQDDEAINLLAVHRRKGIVNSAFADSLLSQAERGKQLSRSQLDWVHMLVIDSEYRSRLPRMIGGGMQQ